MCLSMGYPHHRISFFQSCSSVNSSHRQESFRNWLVQKGSPTSHNFCQKPCFCMDSSPQAAAPSRNVVQHEFSTQPPSGKLLLWNGIPYGLVGDPLWISMVSRETTCITVVFSRGCQEFLLWHLEHLLLPSFTDLAACRALSHFLTPLFYNFSARFLLLFLRTVITEALPLSRPMGLARTRLLCSLLEQTFFCNWQPWFLFTEATPAAPQSSKHCHLYGMKILLM